MEPQLSFTLKISWLLNLFSSMQGELYEPFLYIVEYGRFTEIRQV